MRLFLFDVDGTLVFAHGVGRLALTKAMKEVYGVSPVYEDYDTRGKTDPLGLLTGNVEQGARAKLRPTGLVPYFRVGAYGFDDAERRRLPAIARERAHALTGHAIPFESIVIIGDTPLDVDCARACGARSVAVSTGQHSYDELAACSPDLLFPGFSNVESALRILSQI